MGAGAGHGAAGDQLPVQGQGAAVRLGVSAALGRVVVVHLVLLVGDLLAEPEACVCVCVCV